MDGSNTTTGCLREKEGRERPEGTQRSTSFSPVRLLVSIRAENSTKAVSRRSERERGRGGKEGDKDLPAAFWTLPPPQILSQPSLKEERDLRTRFVDRGFASTKIGFLSLSRISLTRIIFIHIVNWK